MTNKLVQWDEIYFSFSKGYSLSLGRWGLEILALIFPNYSMPWLWGGISVTFVIIAVCLILELFEIKNKLYRCLLSGLIVAFPSLISVFTYNFMSVTYAFAFSLCIGSIFLFEKSGKTGRILATIALLFAFSIYQGFISVVAGFCILLVIKKIFDENFNSKEIIIAGIRYVIFIGIAILGYVICTLIILNMTGTSMDSMLSRTEGEEHMGLFLRFIYVYLYFAGYLVHGTSGLIPTLVSKICHLFCMIGVIICGFGWIKEQKDKIKIILFVLMIIILPFGINCIILISTGTHTLMVYGFISVYILTIMLLEKMKNRELKKWEFIQKAIPVMMGLIILSNIYTANQVYLRMTYEDANLYAFYTELVTRVEMCEGYQQGDKVALIGETTESRYDIDGEFPRVSITGTNEIDVNIYSRKEFIKYYIGNDFEYISGKDLDSITNTDEYKEMSVYPYDGSVKRIGDCIVVNFGSLKNVGDKIAGDRINKGFEEN
jgi:hypothetical protein